jgi:hypothetical protein
LVKLPSVILRILAVCFFNRCQVPDGLCEALEEHLKSVEHSKKPGSSASAPKYELVTLMFVHINQRSGNYPDHSRRFMKNFNSSACVAGDFSNFPATALCS